MQNLSNNSISLAGEFAVLSQLTLRGFDANMTLGRTKSVDILVSNPRSRQLSKVEVKTHYRDVAVNSTLFGVTIEWMMSNKHEEIVDSNLFYVFVNISKAQFFIFLVLPSSRVAEYVRDEHQYWLSRTQTENNESKDMRKFRIGINEESYPVRTPLASEYENRWDFIL